MLMLKEFRQFIMRGNVLDLAVGVIIGSAFTGLVTSLTKNLINPILSIFAGKTDLSGLSVTLLGAKFTYGNFLNDVINFLIILCCFHDRSQCQSFLARQADQSCRAYPSGIAHGDSRFIKGEERPFAGLID